MPRKITPEHAAKNRENGKKGGRPLGVLNRETLERKKVEDAVRQRILLHADTIINSQLFLAKGLTYIYRIDEKEVNGKKVREHVLVTDPDEIKDFLDEHHGGAGVVDDSYYYITTKDPSNIAADSLLNRGIGKPTEVVDVTTKGESVNNVPKETLDMIRDLEKTVRKDL